MKKVISILLIMILLTALSAPVLSEEAETKTFDQIVNLDSLIFFSVTNYQNYSILGGDIKEYTYMEEVIKSLKSCKFIPLGSTVNTEFTNENYLYRFNLITHTPETEMVIEELWIGPEAITVKLGFMPPELENQKDYLSADPAMLYDILDSAIEKYADKTHADNAQLPPPESSAEPPPTPPPSPSPDIPEPPTRSPAPWVRDFELKSVEYTAKFSFQLTDEYTSPMLEKIAGSSKKIDAVFQCINRYRYVTIEFKGTGGSVLYYSIVSHEGHRQEGWSRLGFSPYALVRGEKMYSISSELEHSFDYIGLEIDKNENIEGFRIRFIPKPENLPQSELGPHLYIPISQTDVTGTLAYLYSYVYGFGRSPNNQDPIPMEHPMEDNTISSVDLKRRIDDRQYDFNVDYVANFELNYERTPSLLKSVTNVGRIDASLISITITQNGIEHLTNILLRMQGNTGVKWFDIATMEFTQPKDEVILGAGRVKNKNSIYLQVRSLVSFDNFIMVRDNENTDFMDLNLEFTDEERLKLKEIEINVGGVRQTVQNENIDYIGNTVKTYLKWMFGVKEYEARYKELGFE